MSENLVSVTLCSADLYTIIAALFHLPMQATQLYHVAMPYYLPQPRGLPTYYNHRVSIGITQT